MLFVLAALAFSPPAPQVPCQDCESGGSVVYVDASSTATSPDGSSWGNAYRNLQSAINNALPGDCLWVAAGRYYPDPTAMTDRTKSFRVEKQLTLLGGFDGSENCLNQRAGLFSGTRLSGEIGNQTISTDNSYRVLRLGAASSPIGPPIDIVLDGFNIQGAYNDSSTPEGGGIFCDVTMASVKVRNCIIRDNLAGDGGGLWASGFPNSDPKMDFVRCTFINNEAEDQGGAMWLDGGLSSFSDLGPLVFNSVFKNNEAGEAGGGVFLTGCGNAKRVTFVNNLMHGNQAPRGGFAYLTELNSEANYHDPGLARFYNSTLSNNTATFSNGSAAYMENTIGVKEAKADFINSIVYGNSTPANAIFDELGLGGSTKVDYTVVDTGSAFDCGPMPDCANESGSGACTVWDCNPSLASDFTLQAGSDAIDSGDLDLTLAPSLPVILDYVDLDGDSNTSEHLPIDLAENQREQGTEVDRGAYETSP